jgi:phage baseplate assembly protein W
MPTIDNYIRINPLDLNKNVAIGVAFPFNADAVFNQTFTQKEQVKSNLINVLLTEPGERVNLPDFGVGLKNLLFETTIDTANLEARIDNQVQIYIPEITLISAETNFSPDEHILYIKITYRYNPSNEVDAIQLNFNAQS